MLVLYITIGLVLTGLVDADFRIHTDLHLLDTVVKWQVEDELVRLAIESSQQFGFVMRELFRFTAANPMVPFALGPRPILDV